MLCRFNFFASVKRFIASLLKFFVVITFLLLQYFPNLPQLPECFNEKILTLGSDEA
jgi:hypothetical protein